MQPFQPQSTAPHQLSIRTVIIDEFPSERKIRKLFSISPLEVEINGFKWNFYKMHLIIVYNLFGETKHLLRSWRFSSSRQTEEKFT